MKLSQFRIRIPENLVAMEPPHRTFKNEDGTVDKVYRRDECRLMIVHRKSQRIDLFEKDADGKDTDRQLTFRNIIDYFDEGDTFVLNDTKVFPARLFGTKEKTDAQIEVFLLRELNADMRLWDVLVEPARKIRIGNKLFFNEEGPMVAEVIDNTTSRGRTLRFLYDSSTEEFRRELFSLGTPPLPRYILEQRESTPDDVENFQTIYAKNEGAVTVPASGLHFSRELMKRMEIRGINFAYVTVHCSLGGFDTIEVEDLSKHKMSSEQMVVDAKACDIVNRTKAEKHRICVVGCSTMRAVETSLGTDGKLKEYAGWTNKFIFPPYDFELADAMIANFYHSESTMLMSTAAFGGYDLIMEAYQKAVDNEFHFGCYGDCMLILDD